MSVSLVASMGDDLTVVNAARVSFGVSHDTLTNADRGLITRLLRDGHSSPFRHVIATFRIECSIGCARQIARHAEYLKFNERSTRYSEFEDEFVYPVLKRQVGKAMDYTYELLDENAADDVGQWVGEAYDQAMRSYRRLLSIGVAKEDARYVLPLGIKTALVVTGDLKGWFRFLSQRLQPSAQDEIREIATEIDAAIAGTVAPASWAAWASFGRKPL